MLAEAAPMPDTAAWQKHVADRLKEATQVGIVSPQWTNPPYRTTLLVPSGVQPGQVDDPAISLRDLVGPTQIPGWQARDDLFDEGGNYARRASAGLSSRYLLCEAALARPSDPVLRNTQHVIYRGSVFYWSDMEKTSAAELATVLRQGRSFRLLAAVVQDFDPLAVRDIRPILMMVDALDGDSLLFLEKSH